MITGAGSIRWASASRSHPGRRVRRVNEDACLEQPERALWAAADSMGGHSLGEFASRLATLMDLPVADSLAQYVVLAQELLVGTRSRLFKLATLAVVEDGLAHERAVVVRVNAKHREGQIGRDLFEGFDHQHLASTREVWTRRWVV